MRVANRAGYRHVPPQGWVPASAATPARAIAAIAIRPRSRLLIRPILAGTRFYERSGAVRHGHRARFTIELWAGQATTHGISANLAAGHDISIIALWLGHENISSTTKYLHAGMKLKQATLERTATPRTAGPVPPRRPAPRLPRKCHPARPLSRSGFSGLVAT